ncbi:hypothetical protein [Aureimonas psammosilenae]|uniref:hypothetical protein n=1 Tax=Aureimonas psammosilenae TaxID=2495496 RepID=UPI0012604AFF|nr:hypothetical protein [Aureimonas psammosilenae]
MLMLSGCFSMWAAGEKIYHRQESGFKTLGNNAADEWQADWQRLSSKFGYDGERILTALRSRGAFCAHPKSSTLDPSPSSYSCLYAFCRGPFYQTYSWEFSKGTITPESAKLLYTDMNLGEESGCQNGGNDRRLRGVQRFALCAGFVEGGDCSGYNRREVCKADGWCSAVILEEDRAPISSSAIPI